MDRTAVLGRLRAAIATVGTAAEFCRKHSVSEAYVSEVLSGSKPPADKILAALGLERVVTYREINPTEKDEEDGESPES